MQARAVVSTALVLALSAVPAPLAFAAPGDQGGTVSAPPNPAQVSALLSAILAVVNANGGQGQLQDIVGRLTLALDQAQAGCAVSAAALQQAELTGGLTPVALQALRQTRDALNGCQGTGTAGILSSQSPLGQGTTLGLGGGTSNYTR